MKRMRNRKDFEMPPVMNRSEVQTPTVTRPPRTAAFVEAASLSATRPAETGKKSPNANAPVGSIAAIESLLGC